MSRRWRVDRLYSGTLNNRPGESFDFVERVGIYDHLDGARHAAGVARGRYPSDTITVHEVRR